VIINNFLSDCPSQFLNAQENYFATLDIAVAILWTVIVIAVGKS
jgi:CHASE3 domain sensor protein